VLSTLQPLESRLALSANYALLAPAAAEPPVPVPATRKDLLTTGRNRYWILEPGYTTVFAGNEDGKHKRLTITVSRKTRLIDSILTRVVFERQTSNGLVEEISKNYFAIDRKTKNVFYFGEDVDIYNHGVVVSHDGAWRSGVNGARYGLVMAGDPTLGAKMQEERATGVAQDLAEVIATGIRAHTFAGTFRGSIKTRETSVLEPDSVEDKLYAPGIGLVVDDTLLLVSHTFV
jgi:hypothetical protein